ncbi:MAG TPA: V-type ATP synthase subunit E [Actinobacteria bacterium]|nr:V-type ATP synthase subunit E [Actinomycetota bacterium]
MALEDIVNRVVGDAKKTADEIRDKARTEADQEMAEAKKKAESIKAGILTEVKAEAKREEKRILSLARLEARNVVLAQKRALIDGVFDEALEKLKLLTDEKYRRLLKKMLLKDEVEGDEELILSSEDRKKVGNGFIKELNSSLKTQGKKSDIKLSRETRDLGGGFVFKKGKVELNNSFFAMIETVREELETKIIDGLFGSGE